MLLVKKNQPLQQLVNNDEYLVKFLKEMTRPDVALEYYLSSTFCRICFDNKRQFVFKFFKRDNDYYKEVANHEMLEIGRAHV